MSTPRQTLSRLGATIAFVVCTISSLVSLRAEVDYQRQIQPILTEHCLHCHGVDEGSREGSLRLDIREAALIGGDSGSPAIVEGQPENSELIRRVLSHDASEMMPPESVEKRLTDEEKQLLQDWIKEGAVYQTHWAFSPPVQSPVPSVGPAHPIDAFVVDKLRSYNLSLSAPADSASLCRRLYLDLIGLPPTPEQVAEFETKGFDAVLEELIASERFGEKWGRHWLDLARYSDTNGYEKDLQRDQWIWRDWVIRSYNTDQPYNQFVFEQIAGDLIPNGTQDQLIATGFLRNSMINEEGAIVPEQFRMVEMFDRMDCVGKAVLGLTTQCVQCHTHKYDPITMSEYYGMFSMLNNTYEAKSWIYSAEQLEQLKQIHAEVATLEQQIRDGRAGWEQEIAAWEEAQIGSRPEWVPIQATLLETISGLNHPTQERDGSILMLGHWSNDVFYVAQPDLAGVTGLQLELLTHGDLPFRGPGQGSVGKWDIRELEVLIKKPGGDWEKQKLVNATADWSEPEWKSEDGKQASGPVAYLIDGSDDTRWEADRGMRRNRPSVAVVQFEAPLDVPAGTEIKVVMRMGDMVGCCRVSLTKGANPSAAPIDHDAILAMSIPAEQRSEQERNAIFEAWRKSVTDLASVNQQIDAAYARLPQAMTSVLHMMEREPGDERATFLLDRGNWDQPREPATPSVPASLNPFHVNDQEPLRLQFARWLIADDSPLAARVEVNRTWQVLFGQGLVETPEDFGTRTATPIHRELLDWLAVDFMQHGWSRKHLIRTILTSQTYQQTSRVNEQLLEIDPTNRLLTRGPRFRMDAEAVRDLAMSVSGLITHRMGGPSVIPPVPQSVLDYNYTYPGYWTPATGPERYRRTVYSFRKRSMPDPVASAFDAPNGDLSCARRVRSNTPLAALTSLNETIFVECSRAFALRVLSEAGADEQARIDRAFLLCTSRLPNERERQAVLDLLASQRKRLAEGWLDERVITTGEAGKLPPLPEGATPQDAAAWTIVARVMLNLDETLTKQ